MYSIYYLIRFERLGDTWEYTGYYNKKNYSQAIQIARLLAEHDDISNIRLVKVTEREEYVPIFLLRKKEKRVKLKEIADLLNGREYGREMTKMEEQLCKDFGFVVCFGASDDLIELRGCIDDEADCWNGGEIAFTQHGFHWKENGDGTGHWVGENKITAKWCKDRTEDGERISWTYDTDIPHESFMIYDDEEPYCRGIVFSIEDVI